MPTRIEQDSFGEIAVPEGRLWGAQTQRSLVHFRISDEHLPHELIIALAAVKRSCARVNQVLGVLDADKARAIALAAEEVMEGLHPEEFPLVVWQTGSGTQTNMNLNEVLANRASELLGGTRGRERLVHANDEVNLGQSSNDVFPTAMHLAAVLMLTRRLQPALRTMRATLTHHAVTFADILKLGRTHLQDATPLTLGDEFSGYAAQLRHSEAALMAVLPPLYEVAIGGTAVGTGLNTHPEFGARVAADLASYFSVPVVRASNPFAAIAAHDALVSAHGALRTLATALMKIANDVRWLASGPRSGLGELLLPANEPGSSIMPGKVNPTQCEAVSMVCCQVFGNDVTLGLCAASGAFELNAYKPLITHVFLQSARLLSDAMHSFDVHCLRGIVPDRERIAELMRQSLMLATALVPHLGYDRATEIANIAHREKLSLREAALRSGLVSGADFDRWVRPENMLGGRSS